MFNVDTLIVPANEKIEKIISNNNNNAILPRIALKWLNMAWLNVDTINTCLLEY